MAHPKHDYDSEDFYKLLERTASVCYYDKDVAAILDLDEQTFNTMKNGKYIEWTEEENKRRSSQILKVLTRARSAANLRIWNSMLRVGCGQYKTRSRSVRAMGRPCDCGGKRQDCPLCGGFGYVKVDDGEIPITVTETETELAPNLSAMTTWLYHHDPMYRKVQRGEDLTDEEREKIMARGIDVSAWLRREAELREKAADAPGTKEEDKK